MKLKKNYNTSDIKTLLANGAIIERDYTTDTYGTSSMGYMERKGITINGKQYQVVYTSKGYGRITSDIVYYNYRYLDKHTQYIQDLVILNFIKFQEHFYFNVLEVINK